MHGTDASPGESPLDLYPRSQLWYPWDSPTTGPPRSPVSSLLTTCSHSYAGTTINEPIVSNDAIHVQLSGLSAFNGPSFPSAAAALAIALTAPALLPIIPVPAPSPPVESMEQAPLYQSSWTVAAPKCPDAKLGMHPRQISAFTHSGLPKRPPPVQSPGPAGPSSLSAGCRR